jgi:hypothetical protein
MTAFRPPSPAMLRSPARPPRRRFLQQATAAMMVAALSAVPATLASSDDDPRTAQQWARLKRGLSPKTMAACRKAADRLVPRVETLLKGPEWESEMIRAIVGELKQAGVYPAHSPPAGPGCADAAAATATLPGVGTIIAAVLAVVAAVVILIGQTLAKTLEDQAAAKEGGKESGQKLKQLQERVLGEMESRDGCTLFGKKDD